MPHSRAAVAIVAMPVAMATWSKAAPPAGSPAARGETAASAVVTTFMAGCLHQTMSHVNVHGTWLSVYPRPRVRRDGGRGADDRRARAAHRDDRPQHPRAPVPRAAAAAGGAGPHRLLRPRAPGAHRADPGDAGPGLQPRGDPPPGRGLAGLQRGAAALRARRRRALPRGAARGRDRRGARP